MIVVADAHLHGMGHFQFNKAFLKALGYGYSDTLELHINSVQGPVLAQAVGIGPDHLVTFGLGYPRGLQKIGNTLAEGFRLHHIFRRAQKTGAGGVVVLSVGPVANVVVRVVDSLWSYKVPITLVYHGELQDLVLPKAERRRTVAFVDWSLRLIRPGITGIVLGDSILRGLENLGYATKSLVSVPHPYECPSEPIDHEPKRPLTLVGPGGTSKKKGSHSFFTLADLLHNSGLGPKEVPVFKLVGSWDPGLEPWDNGLVAHGRVGDQIAQDEYDEALQEADFFIFLYPPGSYELMASGAFLDCLRIGRPVLALKTGYFEQVFAEAGEFGMLFENLDQMKDFVVEWAKNPKMKEYEGWLREIEKAREYYSPKRLGMGLSSILGHKFSNQ